MQKSIALEGVVDSDWVPGGTYPNVTYDANTFKLPYRAFGDDDQMLFISPYEMATLRKFIEHPYPLVQLVEGWRDVPTDEPHYSCRIVVRDSKGLWRNVAHPAYLQNVCMLNTLEWWRKKFFPQYGITRFDFV